MSAHANELSLPLVGSISARFFAHSLTRSCSARTRGVVL